MVLPVNVPNGRGFTVTMALSEFIGAHVPLTVTVTIYVPASSGLAFVIVNELSKLVVVVEDTVELFNFHS